jgi:hypothetical protein
MFSASALQIAKDKTFERNGITEMPADKML